VTKPALTAGEDSACLAQLPLKKCCELRDIERRSSLFNANPVDQPHRNPHADRRRLTVYRRDLTHSRHVIRIVQTMPPDAFNLRGAASQAAGNSSRPRARRMP
jgi:GDP-D-mannose dehydratase